MESMNAVEHALGAIREAILTGDYLPGERLKVSGLMRRFGTGAMPAREALRTLEGEGIVSILPNRGAVVRPVDEKFLADLYEVRAAMQMLAVRGTMENLTFEKLHELEALQKAHEQASLGNDLPAVLEADRQFYTALFRIAGNAEAERIFQRGWKTTAALNLRYGVATPLRLKLGASEKAAFLEAIRNHNGPQAETIIIMHNRAGLDDLLTRLRMSDGNRKAAR
jgi:DNA-binding GntR family transcriptional regulator